MRTVSKIPERQVNHPRDPWFDQLFDGQVWELREDDWKARYKTSRSAAAALNQAADVRGVTKRTISIHGSTLYVQAGNGEAKAAVARAKKAPVKKVPAKKVPAKKAAAKAPAKKAAPAKATARKRTAKEGA